MNPRLPSTISRSAFTLARLLLAAACVGSISLNAHAQTGDPPGPLTHLRGDPRPPELDVVHLVNRETLRGTVLNPQLTLHTAYGALVLPTDWIAGVQFDREPGHLDRIETVNRNRLTGFLNTDVELRTESGDTVRLPKPSVQRILFHRRETDATRVATGRFLLLDNGDLLSGQILNWKLLPTPRTRGSPSDLETVESAQFAPGSTNLDILLRSGNETTATLENNPLRLNLDLGVDIQIPLAHIQTLFARIGTLPPPVQREFAPPANATSDTVSPAPGPAPEGLVWIPPGRFIMGSPREEKGRGTDEDPPTEMVITRGFWMGRCEVTQGEFVAVMKTHSSGFMDTTNHPVERVTWNEANAYCEKRTAVERDAGRLPPGYAYRLPTEAEWEYACRAGSTTRFAFGDDAADTELGAYAWFVGNSNSSTHPVGQLKPNAWGLHDMHGNVWEWCRDLWQDAYPGATVTNYSGPTEGWLRIARGGSWLYDASFCRSSNRDNYGPDNRCSDIGFRVVLAPAPLP